MSRSSSRDKEDAEQCSAWVWNVCQLPDVDSRYRVLPHDFGTCPYP